jgi:hypothetical protein
LGIFDFLLGDRIGKFVTAYDSYKRQLDPREEPHMILSKVLINFKYKNHRFDPQIQALAFGETMQFACLPYPENARALAYFYFWQSSEGEFMKNPSNESTFTSLMQPVVRAQANGTFQQLYARYNPRLAQQLEED